MNNTLILRNMLFYNELDSSTNTSISPTCIYKTTVQQLDVSYKKETSIPLSILKNTSSLESIVLYLKDFLGLRFNEIADLLNRDQRTVWVTYSNAKRKKLQLKLDDNIKVIDELSSLGGSIRLPLDIFTSRTFSVLETVVFYLKNTQDISFNQISELLGKNYRTIWTVYKRAMKKLEQN